MALPVPKWRSFSSRDGPGGSPGPLPSIPSEAGYFAGANISRSTGAVNETKVRSETLVFDNKHQEHEQNNGECLQPDPPAHEQVAVLVAPLHGDDSRGQDNNDGARQGEDDELEHAAHGASPFKLSVARLEQAPCNDLGLDLGGTLEDVEDSRVAEHPTDFVFLGVAVAAVNLHRRVGARPGDSCGEQLGHARLHV